MSSEDPIVFDYNKLKIIPGWTNFFELSLLGIAVKLSPENSSIIEFGSFCGRNSAVMANNLNTDCKLHCVDIWSTEQKYPLDQLQFQSQDFDQKLLQQTFEQVAGSRTWEIVWRRFVPQIPTVKKYQMEGLKFTITDDTSIVFIDDLSLEENLERYLNKVEGLNECLLILNLREKQEAAFNLLTTRFKDLTKTRNFYAPPHTNFFILSPTIGHWGKMFPFIVLRYCNRLVFFNNLSEKVKFYQDQLQEQN